MREAATIDPDVPYGHLLEALVLLWEEYDRAPITGIKIEGGLAPSATQDESPDKLAKRARLDELLARVRSAAVWGQEGGEGFADALTALRQLTAGRFPEADAQLTKALGRSRTQIGRSRRTR